MRFQNVYDRLVKINEQQKTYMKNNLKNLCEQQEYTYRLVKQDGELVLCNEKDNSTTRISTLNMLYHLFGSLAYFNITNLSFLKNNSYVFSTAYLEQKDFEKIKTFVYNYQLSTIYFKLVDNMDYYLSKSLLTQQIKEYSSNGIYTIIVYENKVELLSEIPLKCPFTDLFNRGRYGNIFGFRRLNCLNSLYIDNIDISDSTNLSHFCVYNGNLQTIILKNFDTSNITDMSFMFAENPNLKYIELSNIVTGSCKTMAFMFCGCTNLDNLDLNHFNMDQVETVQGMFKDCKSLKELKINNWVFNSKSKNPLCVAEFLFNTGISTISKRELYNILNKE